MKGGASHSRHPGESRDLRPDRTRLPHETPAFAGTTTLA